MMYQLIYISTALTENDPELFQQIATEASKSNKRRDITGLLLYYNGTILQIIEGDKADVTGLYEHIKEDARHKNPMIMDQKPIKMRQFPDWRMGFKPVNDIKDLDFLFELDQLSVNALLPKNQSGPLAAIAKSFVRASGLDRNQ